MLKSHAIIILLVGMITYACRLPMASIQNSESQIYFNSFESAEDTVGWIGNGSFILDNRAAPGGGKYSLKISGGCIIPHARYHIGKMEQDGFLVLQVWGRNLELGGFVSLEVHDDFSVEKEILITDTVWTAYKLSEPVYVSRNSDVFINLNSGGIVYSAMLIDLIRVIITEGE